MRRPAPEVLWTLVLVLALATAGAGVAAIALTRTDDPSSAPPEPSSAPREPSPTAPPPSVTPLEPTAPAPTRTRSGSPAPPDATATTCPDLTERVGLTVLTLNTHGAQGSDGFDIDRVARLVRSADVDVALLQEVDRFRGRSRFSDMPRVLAARTGMDVAYGLNVDLPGRAVSGTATLSRLPILSQRNVRLPTAPGRKPRGLLRTDLDVDGVRVSVFNTHLEDQVMALKLRQVAAVRGPVSRHVPPGGARRRPQRGADLPDDGRRASLPDRLVGRSRRRARPHLAGAVTPAPDRLPLPLPDGAGRVDRRAAPTGLRPPRAARPLRPHGGR